MNNITYAVSVDVNNPIIPYNVYVANVLDSNFRYLEITLYQNGNVITLSNEATATASLVTDDVLIDDSVECTISNNIITVPLEDLQRHGNLDVQVTVTEGTKVLAIPFPIQVRVTPNIAENAQIDENSLGSYAEVVQEIAEARKGHDSLDERLNSDASGMEVVMRKVQSINSQSQTFDNDKYPSVTAVRNYVNVRNDDLKDYIDNELDGLDEAKADKADTNAQFERLIAVLQSKAGKAETLAGYGINDAYTKAEVDEAKVSKPSTSPNGTNGQLLRTKGDGTTEWVNVIDSTLSTQGAAAEAKTTGNYINVLTDRETALDGIVSQEWEIGMRYLVNGVETWSGTSTSRMSTKPGTYIRFNKDDLIVVKKTVDYQFLVVYSTDNGSTWTSTSNRDLYYSILEDSIGWICIKKASGTFTEEEMQSVVNNYFFILRKGTGEIKKNALLAEALSIASGSFDRSEIIDSKYGFTYQDAKTTNTVVVSADLLLPEFEASKGDIFAIKASISIDYPDMYSNIGVRIYERYNGNTVKTTDITDISDTIIYTVSNSNADAIHIKGLLLADEGDITTRHNEIFDYKISVVKKLPGEIEELLTEAGDIWEV